MVRSYSHGGQGNGGFCIRSSCNKPTKHCILFERCASTQIMGKGVSLGFNIEPEKLGELYKNDLGGTKKLPKTFSATMINTFTGVLRNVSQGQNFLSVLISKDLSNFSTLTTNKEITLPDDYIVLTVSFDLKDFSRETMLDRINEKIKEVFSGNRFNKNDRFCRKIENVASAIVDGFKCSVLCFISSELVNAAPRPESGLCDTAGEYYNGKTFSFPAFYCTEKICCNYKRPNNNV